MSLSPITPLTPSAGLLAEANLEATLTGKDGNGPSPEDAAKAAKQFESILVRQFIEPSIKSMMTGLGGGGPGGDVYGYFMVDSLANAITDGGGLGLTSILEMQFKGAMPQAPETES